MVHSIHYICKEFQNFQSPFMYIIWCFILTTTSYSYPSSKCRCFFNSHFILLNCLLKIAQDCYPVSYLDSRSFISFDALDQFSLLSSVQLLGCVWLFTTPWTAARRASLTITNSWSPPKPMSIESVMPSNHPILCRPLLLATSTFPSIRVFSKESALYIRWPKY